MIYTEQLYETSDALMEFINECDKLGFKNNNTLGKMNFRRTLKEGGKWFATYHNNKMVAISGLHEFMDGWRALYRGCQLYSMPGGLSKNHMNCWMFYYHLPIVFEKHYPVYVTTNVDNDASGKMLKLNKLYWILNKAGIVQHVKTGEIRGVKQNVWKLNEEKYMEARSKVK